MDLVYPLEISAPLLIDAVETCRRECGGGIGHADLVMEILEHSGVLDALMVMAVDANLRKKEYAHITIGRS